MGKSGEALGIYPPESGKNYCRMEGGRRGLKRKRGEIHRSPSGKDGKSGPASPPRLLRDCPSRGGHSPACRDTRVHLGARKGWCKNLRNGGAIKWVLIMVSRYIGLYVKS